MQVDDSVLSFAILIVVIGIALPFLWQYAKAALAGIRNEKIRDYALTVVNGLEQMVDLTNPEKLERATKALHEFAGNLGFKLTEDQVRYIIEAAVRSMKRGQS